MKVNKAYQVSKTDRINKNSIVSNIKTASRKQNRLAMVAGAILGAFVPIASYVLVHVEASNKPALWALVTGGLIFSAQTVFQWAKSAFGGKSLKALGFVVILEGVLTFSDTPALSISALVLLVGINGIANGCALALEQKEHVKKN